MVSTLEIGEKEQNYDNLNEDLGNFEEQSET